MTKYLNWNVFWENFNSRQIETYNVLSQGMVSEIINRTKTITDKQQFANEVKSLLMYHYWSRSEYEVIVTDWPTHITKTELCRLNDESEQYFQTHGRDPYQYTVNLTVEKKIDIWDQINLNWEHFVDYLWKELKTDA